jgi:hypothetical protein
LHDNVGLLCLIWLYDVSNIHVMDTCSWEEQEMPMADMHIYLNQNSCIFVTLVTDLMHILLSLLQLAMKEHSSIAGSASEIGVT